MLRDFCALYNAGLQQRIEAYGRRGVSLNYGMQAGELKAVRACHEGLARWSFSAEQQVLRKLDKAFRAFFGRLKRGDKVGRSEEHTSELQSLMRISTAVFCLTKKKQTKNNITTQ